MCHEFWRYEQERAEGEEARKRAQEMIENARSAPPVTQEPATAPEEEEAVPA